ncbi:MAG: hypothetical protein M3P27_11580 [Acidobacteriota bacterium]|nr:hypothetical protein [Acidobacteriota bacterium]
MNILILVSLTLFGFSAGAALVHMARKESGEIGPAPGLWDVLLLLGMITAGIVLHLRFWRNWPMLVIWLLSCVIVSAIAQGLQAVRDRGNLLTQ